MSILLKKIFCAILLYFISVYGFAQLNITGYNNATATSLAQKLVGDGVVISNATYTGAKGQAGFFKNVKTVPSLGMDSGIVLSTGYVKTGYPYNNVIGLDAEADDGFFYDNIADNDLGRNGDKDLDKIVASSTNDAAVLEFDFVPLGDSIQFRYVFGSEEYPDYNCTDFTDAFAFFISGAGFTGLVNLALIPGTTIPVSINSINDGTTDKEFDGDIKVCRAMGTGSPFKQYYINNSTGKFLALNGFTKILVAKAKVTPCTKYHLKIVIADGYDNNYDSGVFLEAKSLKSDNPKFDKQNIPAENGVPYLVEGCKGASFSISRAAKLPVPSTINLIYAGTATNGVDVSALPASVTIPANDSVVTVPISALTDNIPEGVEQIKIYIPTVCSNGIYADSLIIDISEYDNLSITPDTATVCNGVPFTLSAPAGYTTYNWDANPTLSATNTQNVKALPTAPFTTYYCTATIGTCKARDSVVLKNNRKLILKSKGTVDCANPVTTIVTDVTGDWQAPYQFSINGGTYQNSGTFNNITSGDYIIRIKDAGGCLDSIKVTIPPAGSSLVFSNVIVNQPGCGTTKGSIELTVTGGTAPYTYSLDGISFSGNNKLIDVPEGTYNAITAKDQSGCIATTKATITALQNITIDAGKDTTICEGDSYKINAVSSATTIKWAASATLNNTGILTPVATPLVTTKYYVTATTGNCSAIDSITISVNPAPVANAGKDVTICYGNNIQLNGSGGSLYQWQGDNALTNPGTFNPVIVNPSAGTHTYSLTVTDSKGCKSLQPDMVTVTVASALQLDAGADATICEGNTYQIKATSSAGSVKWAASPTLSNTGILNPVATPTVTTKYYVTASNTDCSVTDSITIFVNPAPIADAGSDVTICYGNNTQLNGSGGTVYKWSGDNALTNPDTFNPTIVNPSVGTHTYPLTVTDSKGCKSLQPDMVTVTVGAALQLDAGANATICQGDSYTINATSTAASVKWTASATLSNTAILIPVATPTVTTKYYITASNADCSVTDSVTIFVNPAPVAVAGNDITICYGNNTQLNGSGGTSYTWQGDNALNNPNIFNPTVINPSIGTHTYSLTVTDSKGCKSLQPDIVTVTVASPLQLDAGADATICQGESYTISATSSAPTVKWNASASLNNTNTLTPVATPSVTTKYYVTASNTDCSVTDSITVFVNAAPVANAGNDITICYGSNTQLNGSGGTLYQWQGDASLANTGIFNPSIINPTAGTHTYLLTVTDAKGCKSLKPDAVNVIVTPALQLNAGNDISQLINQPIQLNIPAQNNVNFTSFTWTPSYGLNNPNIRNPIAILDKSITYTITASTTEGCKATDTLHITIFAKSEMYIPSAFTPNNDGTNDIFRIVATGMKALTYFNIYNRWGQLIFSSSNFNKGWDGKVQGVGQNSGTYPWIIEAIDMNGNVIKKQGTVILIR